MSTKKETLLEASCISKKSFYDNPIMSEKAQQKAPEASVQQGFHCSCFARNENLAIRVSFCTDHPMQFRLEQRGRNLVLLKIDVEVAYFENTIFCNINATDSNHKKGQNIEDLERIRFSATKRTFVSREDPDFKHHQAEVLVKTWIPLEHITNINAFA